MSLARSGWILAVAAISSACGATSAEEVGASTDELRAPPADGFSFDVSRDEKEKSAPVTKSGDSWKTIYTVRLDNLDSVERIAARGEVQLTRCHASDVAKGTPCKSALPDNADNSFDARIIIGNDANNAAGDRVSQQAAGVTCSHFDHHCAVAIDEATTTGLQGTKFIKLVVAAKGDGKLMIVDEGHGGLAITRIGKDADRAGKSFTTNRKTDDWMASDQEDIRSAQGLPGRKEHITFQQRIDDARPGDVIDVDARIIAVTKSGGARPANCSGAREPLINHQVFLSTGPDVGATKVGALTAKNGTNCRLDAQCTYEKSGATKVPSNHDPGKPIFVSVVSMGGRSCAASNDEWRIDGASKMDVRRRR